MQIKTNEFQVTCKSILEAVDEGGPNQLFNDSLEIEASNGILKLNVTNKEYFVTVNQQVDVDENFRAVVYAPLFLKFISKVTTPTIELVVVNNHLVVKANGTYKFPLLFDTDKMIELPRININNPTLSMEIDGEKLLSILLFNKKELDIHDKILKPIQRLFYLDEQGCVTFSSGACINSFTLSSPIKVLLPGKIIKLFKLFNKDSKIKLTLGYDNENGTTRQKISFSTDVVSITALLLNDETLTNSFPVTAIRNLGNKPYPYNININKLALIETISRLQLFMTGLHSDVGTLEFKENEVIVIDRDEVNKEVIPYINTTLETGTDFKIMINLSTLKLILETCVEQHVSLHFGDDKAVVLSRGNVKNIIPQQYLV